jgi:ATP-binding cassette subfamily C protein
VWGPVLGLSERQLVALTRVYLSPAHLVILDEGTCYLDPAAESTAERAFRKRPGTLIVVAHRMSSARRADRILVMDNGSPMTGTHEHLLAASPLYRELIGHWTDSTVHLGRNPARSAPQRTPPPGSSFESTPGDREELRRGEAPGTRW